MIVFATPLFGGMCTAEYADSMARLQSSLDLSGLKYKVLHQINDSLIPRARNCLVARFMRDPELKDYTHFMFIDADIQFEPEDVAKLWNLSEHNEVVTACYPTKTDKKELPKTTAWKDGKLVDLDEFDGQTEIDYAGTGFLMIKRTCLEKMQQAYPETRHVEGHLGEVYALCDTELSDQHEKNEVIKKILNDWRSGFSIEQHLRSLDALDKTSWQDRWYVSEDYSFCKRWRAIGGEIILDPSIRLGHVGRKIYLGA